MTKKTAPKVPKTLGGCADRLFSIRDEIAALNKKVDLLKKEKGLIEDHLINTLPKDDAKGVTGRNARVTIVSKEIPTVRDWDKFYKHILKTKDFSFLQRRVSEGPVKERWEDGKKVPGVEPFNVKKVSLNKVR